MLNEQDAAIAVDLGALSMLAENYNMFIEAGVRIAQDGVMITNSKGDLVKHPLIKVQTDAQIQAVKIMTEFGLTAKSRERLKAISGDGVGEDDPLMDYLRRRGG